MKIKIIKLEDINGNIPEEHLEKIGTVHEAIEFQDDWETNEADRHKYVIGMGNGYWTLPAHWCEVVEEHTFETEQAISKNANFPNGILLVEDGSVDIDKLEEDGFYVISYRQGSEPPKFL